MSSNSTVAECFLWTVALKAAVPSEPQQKEGLYSADTKTAGCCVLAHQFIGAELLTSTLFYHVYGSQKHLELLSVEL